MKKKVMLAGAGGYGELYVRRLIELENAGKIEVVGVVDPFAKASKLYSEIETRGWAIFESLADFYAERTCELACIATPIKLHTPMIIDALEHGSNVLCEKPLCGDARDIERLIETRDRAGKFVMIGYQWSHADAILSMKRDVMSGVYGEPELLKTLILWPRNEAYFRRGTGWAGKIRDKDGALILDSVANNATAHYLHNIFFTLGKTLDSSLEVTNVSAQLYRTNPIENFDTALISCDFDCGAKALYIASHSTDKALNPIFEYRFTNGTIVYDESAGKRIVGRTASGEVRDYGDPFADQMQKIDMAVANIDADEPFIPCPIEAAAVHTRCIAECAKLPISDFEESKKRKIGEPALTYIDGLYDKLVECYKSEKML